MLNWCQFGEVGRLNGDCPGCWIVGEVSQSTGSIGFMHNSLPLIIRLYGLASYIYCKKFLDIFSHFSFYKCLCRGPLENQPLR